MEVLLEKFIESDHLPIIEGWEEEKEIFKFQSHSRPKYLREKDGFADRKTLLYMIKLDSIFIGTAWLEDITLEDAKLGIYIADISSRGKGIGKEIVRRLIEIASNELRLKSIYLNVRDYNDRAIRCYSKCGFKVTQKTDGLTFSDGSHGGKYEMTLFII
ncbi:MAG TPA: GNAT family N-acetyltransferase [Clostridia bacterium]|nr:GNAT family N-acetyltransferase [Clostridia bacterium]